MSETVDNTRVLVADDSEQIHRAFQAILMPGTVPRDEMADLGFLDDRAENLTRFHDSYTIDFATQGQEALAKIQ
ncbi:hypothetical protein GF324_05165, partial [bacterium]|nr:hypothetical protein [bacterium]